MTPNSFTYLSKLSSKKLSNASKLYLSYQYSKVSGTPKIFGLPMSVSIEPTTACNLRCPECPSGLRSFTRPTGNLQVDFFRKVIQELSKYLIHMTFYFQGEPFIHPQFLDMVTFASNHGVYTMTSTNGHFLDDKTAKQTVESGLDKLIISIDGATQEVYEQYRREGSLKKVLDGTKNVVRWKKKLNKSKLQIVWQFLVVKPNEHQISEVHRMAKKIGVDQVKLKTAQIYDYKNDQSLIPTMDQYSRYSNISGEYQIKNELLNQCWKMWHSCVITWDGKVVPCCFDKDAEHVLGDLNQNTMEEIWFGERYTDFRNRIIKGRDQIEICTNCTEGCKVFA